MQITGWMGIAAMIVAAMVVLTASLPELASALAGPGTIVLALLTAALAWSTQEMTRTTKAALEIEQRRSFPLPVVIKSFGWIDESRNDADGASIEIRNSGTLPCTFKEAYVAAVRWREISDEDGFSQIVGIDEDPYEGPLDDSLVSRLPPGRKWMPNANHTISLNTTEWSSVHNAGYNVRIVFTEGVECETSIQPVEVEGRGGV